ncbi:MAG: hypothetical protein ACQERF_09030 [Actinomycetota bacterium]
MAQRRFYRIADLSGGLNPDQNPVMVADNEATAVRNVRFDKLGSLISRRGYSRLVDADPGSDILTLGRWAPEGSPGSAQVLAHLASGSLVEVDTGYPVIETGLSTTRRGDFASAGDKVLYADGADVVIYDGTTSHKAGIVAPVAGWAAAAADGGSLAVGSFSYQYTFYDSAWGVESNPSPAVTATTSGTDLTINLSTLPGTHARADKIRLYRTDAGGTVHYFLVELPIATTSYSDNGSVAPAITVTPDVDNVPPLDYERIAYFKGYVFGSIGNTLYWSKPYEPEQWPTLDFTEVPFEGNDEIRALWAFQDTLLVFGRRNVVLVAGEGGTPNSGTGWSLSRVDLDTGIANSRCAVEIGGSLVYLSHQGLRAFPGAQPFVPKLDRVFAAMPLATIEAAAMTYVPEERALWVAVDGKIYTVHVPNMAIGTYSLSTTGFLTGGESGFELPLFIDSELRHVNQYGGDTDNGTSIVMHWKSKIFQLENPETIKAFRRIGAFASVGSSGTVTITISDAGESSSVTLESLGEESLAVWDSAIWDTSRFATDAVSYFIGALPAQRLRGHTFQVTVEAVTSTPTEVVAPITFEYREANRFLGRP